MTNLGEYQVLVFLNRSTRYRFLGEVDSKSSVADRPRDGEVYYTTPQRRASLETGTVTTSSGGNRDDQNMTDEAIPTPPGA